MDIIVATKRDLPAIERFYREVADEMHGGQHDVWWDFGVHPTVEGLRAAASAGNLFIARSDGAAVPLAGEAAVPPVLGAFVLDGRQGADYGVAPWRVSAPAERIAVLHLVAVAPSLRGRGLAGALLDAAIAEARRRGAMALRLDVFDNNAPAIAAYRRAGFEDLGVFDIEVGGGLRHTSHLMELDLCKEAGSR